jgi:hypothetical protein
MSGFRDDFGWQEKFSDQIKQIVGPKLLMVAPLERDMREATDFLVFVARDMRIACRIRRPKFLDDYPWDFTIRHHRETGAVTEMQKIKDGWGDWMFYGFSNKENQIARYMIINLAHFRSHLIDFPKLKREGRPFKCQRKDNGDGTSFLAFDVRTFPKEPQLLISSSWQ